MSGFGLWNPSVCVFILTVNFSVAFSHDGSADTLVSESYSSTSVYAGPTNRGVASSPGLVGAVVVLFLVVFVVLCVQCALILRLMRRQSRLVDTRFAAPPSAGDHELYDNINQAEFITSLSGKLERNDSIGSSSLNFLSPDMTQSVNSLCNIGDSPDEGSASGSQTGVKQYRVVRGPRRDSRQEAIVYCEIQHDGRKKYSVRKVSDLSESYYARINGGRPVSYFEIPGVKNTPSSHLTPSERARTTGAGDPLDGVAEERKSLNVAAEVHPSPREGDRLYAGVGSRSAAPREPSAIYLEVFADQAEYDEFAAARDAKRLVSEENTSGAGSSYKGEKFPEVGEGQEVPDGPAGSITAEYSSYAQTGSCGLNREWSGTPVGSEEVRLINETEGERDADNNSVGYVIKLQNKYNRDTCKETGKLEETSPQPLEEFVV